MKPSRSQPELVAFAQAALHGSREQAASVAMQGVAEHLAREAETYLAVVDFFRAEGFEPGWRSDDRAIPARLLYGLDAVGEVSATGEGIEG